MTGWARLGKLFKELAWFYEPDSGQDVVQLIIPIVFLLVAFVARKEFGGFWKAVGKMLWAALVLIILNAISPWLMGAVVAIGLICVLIPKSGHYIKWIALGVAVAGAVVLAFYNVFLA